MQILLVDWDLRSARIQISIWSNQSEFPYIYEKNKLISGHKAFMQRKYQRLLTDIWPSSPRNQLEL